MNRDEAFYGNGFLINDKKTFYVVKTKYSDLFKIYVNVYPLLISFVSVKKKVESC